MNLFKSKKDDKKTEREKLEERREEVLAHGRKFKYPLQYTKHRIVTNTILIAFVIVALCMVGGWFALYRLQTTDELLYRVTTFLPISVANVDDENVKFSDYLMLYRSSIASIERQSSTVQDDEALKNQYKRVALSDAEQYTYAIKLGSENDIKITDEEIEKEFNRHRQVGGIDRSEEVFLKILKDNFGLSKDEYHRMLYLNLMKARVSEKIDINANKIADEIEEKLASNGGNFLEIAKSFGDKIKYEETDGLVDSKNIDGGRATEALKLKAGEQSGKFVSINGDGYYFVKLISKTESEVNFVSIFVPFTEFEKRFAELGNNQLVKEYIRLE